jgi:hypothetical protein
MPLGREIVAVGSRQVTVESDKAELNMDRGGALSILKSRSKSQRRVTIMGGLSFLIPRLAVRGAVGQREANEPPKKDLMGYLSRDLDRVREKRDALAFKREAIASDVTTLTTQIAELETRIAKEKDRRERERVAGEIEGIKKRLKDTATTFTLAIAGFCEAAEAAATLVPEARELNSFLLSVTAGVDITIDSLSRELQRQMEAVSEGRAALDLQRPVGDAPQPSKNDEGIGSAPPCESSVGDAPQLDQVSVSEGSRPRSARLAADLQLLGAKQKSSPL